MESVLKSQHAALLSSVPRPVAEVKIAALCKCRYFISGFEREGQWLAGGGMVPLSRAICCRPCLPKRLPPQLAALNGHDNVTIAVAIVSIGCHKSAAIGAHRQRQHVALHSVVAEHFAMDHCWQLNTAQSWN